GEAATANVGANSAETKAKPERKEGEHERSEVQAHQTDRGADLRHRRGSGRLLVCRLPAVLRRRHRDAGSLSRRPPGGRPGADERSGGRGPAGATSGRGGRAVSDRTPTSDLPEDTVVCECS